MKNGTLKLAASLVLMGISLAATGKRIAIEPAEIANALVSAGLRIRADQIQPLTLPFSSSPNPKLTLENITPGNGSVTARMRCERTSVCLPFLVLLRRDANRNDDAFPGGQARAIKKDLLVRTGKKATMVLEAGSMRITLPVISLQNGIRGEMVRVISGDRKRIFTARVTGPAMVTAGGNSKGASVR